VKTWLSALVLVLALFAARPAAALDLVRVPAADTPRVVFRVEPGLEASARRMAPGVTRKLAEIESDLPDLPHVGLVEVRLVKHAESLSDAAPPGQGAPAWAIGVAFPEAGVVVVAARGRDGELLDMPSTLAHELAHMALERALGDGRAPRWLHEGFAYLHSSEFSWGRAETLAGAAFRSGTIPLGALEASFPARHDEASLAYAESYDFVAFLAQRGRQESSDDDGDRWPFRRFLRELAHGQPVGAAAMTAYGRSIDQLEGEWYESLRSRYFFYPVAALGGFFWLVIALLSVVAWRRKRRQMQRQLAQMEAEERAHAAAAAAAAATTTSILPQ
jgi:hypothetical protein